MRIYIERKVTVSANADDWSLFGGFDDDEEDKFADREFVAQRLNETLGECCSEDEFNWSKMEKVMNTYSHYGACDSEAYHFIESVIEEVYG